MEILLTIVTVIIIWGIVLYNRLVKDKNQVLAAWSDIDVQLKRRHDLIPKLVEAVNAYANYESQTLSRIVNQRSQSTTQGVDNTTNELELAISEEVKQLLLLVEDYPELKANTQYLNLLQQLSEVENQIQFARRFYNGSVKNLNVRIASFPDMLIAKPFSFKPANFFQLESVTEP